MNKQRAQAIMEHVIYSVGHELDDWKLSERVMTDIGLRCSWLKDLDQLSIIILLVDSEEGIIVCGTGPDGVIRRHFRNVSSASGEKAIKALISFGIRSRANSN